MSFWINWSLAVGNFGLWLWAGHWYSIAACFVSLGFAGLSVWVLRREGEEEKYRRVYRRFAEEGPR